MIKEFIVPTVDLLKNYIENRSMSQKEFSKKIGMSEKSLSNFLNGKEVLTEELASKFEEVFEGIPKSYWLNYESKYREVETNERVGYSFNNKQLSEISKKFRFKEVFNGLDWDLERQAEEMLSILQISNFNQFEEEYSNLAVDFMEDGGEIEPIAIWLNLCREEIEIQNEDISEVQYNKRNLLDALPIFKDIAYNKNIESSLQSARKLCNTLGINLVIQEAITNSKVRGALVIYENHPSIYLSLRFRFHDYVWFALVHELAHLILHYDTDQEIISLDEDDTDDYKTKKEIEANKFTQDFFIDPDKYKIFIEKRPFTQSEIEIFAHEQNILPGIVVARLQHDGYISYDRFTYLKTK